MEHEVILTEAARGPVGPYSQAIRAGGMVFVSGQLPIDLCGEMAEGIPAQTRLCLDNIKAILEAAACDMDRIVKCTVYITNMDDFAEMNAAYAAYFPENPPARACVEVSRLARGANVEIEAIAMI